VVAGCLSQPLRTLRRKQSQPRIKPGSIAYTDNFASYRILNAMYRHETVNHSIGEYARGEAEWGG